jgi:hypothetical protein
MGRFYYDPLGYVRYVFDWGHGELKGETGPDVWQEDVLADIGRRMRESDTAVRYAISSGHGIGKFLAQFLQLRQSVQCYLDYQKWV